MPLNPLVLKDSHYIAMHLQVSGYSFVDIAGAVGLTVGYLTNLANTPLYQAELELLRERMRDKLLVKVVDKLVNKADKALDTIVDIVEDPNAPRGMRLTAARDLLDRVPQTSKVHRGQSTLSTGLNLSDEQAQLIAETFAQDNLAQLALREAREALGVDTNNIIDDMIDITPSGVETTGNDDNNNSSSYPPSNGHIVLSDDLSI